VPALRSRRCGGDRAPSITGEPTPRAKQPQAAGAKDFQGRTWATRKRPWVDRLATAWLITRFVDRSPRFIWIDSPKRCPKSAIGYDFDGARFSHVDDKVAFESFAHVRLDGDPRAEALGRTGALHRCGRIPLDAAAGIETVMRGLQAQHADDNALLAAALPIFDSLRAAMKVRNEHPGSDRRRAPALFRRSFRLLAQARLISFGGPAGQIAIMHEELVERRRWISEQRFLHALNYCMLLPGPEAQQLATYIGWLMHRTRGGLSPAAVCTAVALHTDRVVVDLHGFGNVPVIAGFFSASSRPSRHWSCMPLTASVREHSKADGYGDCRGCIPGGLALHVPFPAIVLVAGIAGTSAATTRRTVLDQRRSRQGGADRRRGVHRRRHAYAVARPFHLAAVFALVLISVWFCGSPRWCVCGHLRRGRRLTQMGWFFTKAALLTFGGAYAVLPTCTRARLNTISGYAATDHRGLALGETTPGPLIMVVAFVGFVADGPRQFSDRMRCLAGVVAAIVVYVLHVPASFCSFSRRAVHRVDPWQLEIHRAAHSITAAVVGVIVNLACSRLPRPLARRAGWTVRMGCRPSSVLPRRSPCSASRWASFLWCSRRVCRAGGAIAAPAYSRESTLCKAVSLTFLRSRRPARPVGKTGAQPSREQLCRRGKAAQRHSR